MAEHEKTPEGLLKRAQALRDDGYEEIPIYRLLGRNWIEDQAIRAVLRQLRRAGLIHASPTPGFLLLG